MMRNLTPGDLVKKAWDLCNQDWPGCSIMKMMHWKVIVFLGGAISFYSVSCMSDVIFNPSLLNWSSLILTVAHIYVHFYALCPIRPSYQLEPSIYLSVFFGRTYPSCLYHLDSHFTRNRRVDVSTDPRGPCLRTTKQYIHLILTSQA